MMAALGPVIAEQRKFLGLSVIKLAQITGVSKNTIWQIERGQRDIYLSTLVALADGLELTVSDLLELCDVYIALTSNLTEDA